MIIIGKSHLHVFNSAPILRAFSFRKKRFESYFLVGSTSKISTKFNLIFSDDFDISKAKVVMRFGKNSD